MRGFLRPVLVLALSFGACRGLRSTPETRYANMMLNARTLGAAPLAAAVREDAVVRGYVAAHGQPDYVYETGAGDLELVWYEASRVAHFRRDPATGTTRVGERSPVPTPLANVLDPDLRAGTPAPLDADDPGPPLVQCWTVPVAEVECRTCCRTSEACDTDCR